MKVSPHSLQPKGFILFNFDSINLQSMITSFRCCSLRGVGYTPSNIEPPTAARVYSDARRFRFTYQWPSACSARPQATGQEGKEGKQVGQEQGVAVLEQGVAVLEQVLVLGRGLIGREQSGQRELASTMQRWLLIVLRVLMVLMELMGLAVYLSSFFLCSGRWCAISSLLRFSLLLQYWRILLMVSCLNPQSMSMLVRCSTASFIWFKQQGCSLPTQYLRRIFSSSISVLHFWWRRKPKSSVQMSTMAAWMAGRKAGTFMSLSRMQIYLRMVRSVWN